MNGYQTAEYLWDVWEELSFPFLTLKLDTKDALDIFSSTQDDGFSPSTY